MEILAAVNKQTFDVKVSKEKTKCFFSYFFTWFAIGQIFPLFMMLNIIRQYKDK